MLTLQEAKDFLRIDADMTEEDVFLSSLISASNLYVLNATSPYADQTTDIYKLTQLFLIANWYENRSNIGKVEESDFHLKSLLVQIAYTANNPDSTGTGSTSTIIYISDVINLQSTLDNLQTQINGFKTSYTIDDIADLRATLDNLASEIQTIEQKLTADETNITNLQNQMTTKAEQQNVDDLTARVENLEAQPTGSGASVDDVNISTSTPFSSQKTTDELNKKFDKTGGDLEGNIHQVNQDSMDIYATLNDGTEGGIFIGGTQDFWWKDKAVRLMDDGVYINDGTGDVKLHNPNNLYEKTEIDTKLNNKANIGDSYLKAESNTNFASKSSEHTHSNKATLDKLSDNGTNLLFNGSAIGGSGGSSAAKLNLMLKPSASWVVPTAYADAPLNSISWDTSNEAATVYDTTTYTFTVPRNGIYRFNFKSALLSHSNGITAGIQIAQFIATNNYNVLDTTTAYMNNGVYLMTVVPIMLTTGQKIRFRMFQGTGTGQITSETFMHIQEM